MSPPSRCLVLGLDGATFDVLRPLAAQGRLPNLAAWMQQGDARPLRSTVPPMSFPAWSSFLTGLDPGAHGLFDFTQKLAGAYRIRFTNATDRRGATLLGRASRAGRRVLALGIPATHPPEPVAGFLVAGFHAPVSATTGARSASDPARYAAIAARAGPWKRPDLDESARGAGWHERAAAVLLARIESKTRFALEALAQLHRDGSPVDLAVIVFAESDTVAHHYWRDHDPDSPRHDPAASARRRGAVSAVYERLDAACGALREAFGADAPCVVLSDHGTGGAARHVVHLNARLAECGLLRRAPGRSAALAADATARRVRDLALRALPPRIAERVFRRARAAAARVESTARFGGIDWKGSVAFSEEANTQPGVWINRSDREARGTVDAPDYERVRDLVIEALRDWTLPGGEPVVARARRREEVYTGPCVERAPDVIVELGSERGYPLTLVPTPWHEPQVAALRRLRDDELAGGRGRGMNGTHRPDGVWIASGGAEGWLETASPALPDVAPALLRGLGVPWDADRDAGAAPSSYTPEEEAAVAARLRALGYLE